MLEYNLKQTLIKFWNKAKQNFALKTDLAQPDWNQNDDTQPDYVNNRTHWEEPEIYNEVFREENLNYTSSGNLTIYQVNSNIPILSEGRHYELNIGEYKFDGICKKFENVAGSYGYYIGNGSISIQDEPDTGEDFIVYTSGRTLSAPENMWFIMKNNSPTGEYDTLLALHEGGVHRLDKKFLPDDVVYSDDIAQPDWEQNDVTSKSHILNRTHWEIPATVIMNKTFPAPGDGTVFFNLDIPLVVGELYTVSIQGLPSGDTTEEIVAAGDSDGAYLSNSKGLEIGYSAAGFPSGYNAYYTGIGANYGEVVTITKSGELHRLDKKFLPLDSQGDWDENEETKISHIKNRTHWSERSPFVYDNVKLNVSFTVDEWDLVPEESESSESEGFMYTYDIPNIDPELFERAIGEFESHEDKDSYLEVTLFGKKYKPLRSISENSVGLILDEPDENSIYEIKVSLETNQEDPYVQLQVFTTDELTETEGNVEYFGEETVHQLDSKYVPSDFVRREDLAPVALSGNYNDLQNRYRQQVHTTDITQEMVANTFYVWDNPLTENDSFSPEFSTDEDETIVNEYAGIFTTGDTVPTLAMPGGIIWLGGLPTLLPNHIYEFSVINEYGVFSPQDYTTTEMVQTMIDNARIQWEDLN